MTQTNKNYERVENTIYREGMAVFNIIKCPDDMKETHGNIIELRPCVPPRNTEQSNKIKDLVAGIVKKKDDKDVPKMDGS